MTNRKVRIYASVVQLGVCAAAAAVCCPEEGGGCVQRNDGSRIVFGTNGLFEESDENIGLRSGQYGIPVGCGDQVGSGAGASRADSPAAAYRVTPRVRQLFFQSVSSRDAFLSRTSFVLSSFSSESASFFCPRSRADTSRGPPLRGGAIWKRGRRPWRSSEGGNRSGGKDDVNAALGALKRQALRTGCARGCGRNLPFAKGGILRAPVKAFPASSVR